MNIPVTTADNVSTPPDKKLNLYLDSNTLTLSAKNSAGQTYSFIPPQLYMVREYNTAVVGFDNVWVNSDSTSSDQAFRAVIFGDNNKYKDGDIFVGNDNESGLGLNVAYGQYNKLYQGCIAIGSNNQLDKAVNITAIGMGNTCTDKAMSSFILGDTNTINNKYIRALGSRLNLNAQGTYAIGKYYTVADQARNRYAFCIGSGKKLIGSTPVDAAVSFIHRVRRNQLNPAYDASKDPQNTGKDSQGQYKYNDALGFQTQYMGCIKPVTQSITVTQGAAVILQTHLYSRFVLTGTGACSVQVSDTVQQGDMLTLVYNTQNITPTFPQQWILKGQLGTGLLVIKIADILGTIYYKQEF